MFYLVSSIYTTDKNIPVRERGQGKIHYTFKDWLERISTHAFWFDLNKENT